MHVYSLTLLWASKLPLRGAEGPFFSTLFFSMLRLNIGMHSIHTKWNTIICILAAWPVLGTGVRGEGMGGKEKEGKGRGSSIFLSPLPPFLPLPTPSSLPHPVRRTGNTAIQSISIQYLRRNLTFGILRDQNFIVQMHENYKRNYSHVLG